MDVGLRRALDAAGEEWRSTGILSLASRARIYESLGPAGNPRADRRRGLLGLAAARHVAAVWRAAWAAAADWDDAALSSSAGYTGCGPASVEHLIAAAEATLTARIAYGDAILVSVGFYEELWTAEALEDSGAAHGASDIGARACCVRGRLSGVRPHPRRLPPPRRGRSRTACRVSRGRRDLPTAA